MGMPSDHLVTDLFDHLILLNEAFRLGYVAGEQKHKEHVAQFFLQV